jgi:hypothetical protein
MTHSAPVNVVLGAYKMPFQLYMCMRTSGSGILLSHTYEIMFSLVCETTTNKSRLHISITHFHYKYDVTIACGTYQPFIHQYIIPYLTL